MSIMDLREDVDQNVCVLYLIVYYVYLLDVKSWNQISFLYLYVEEKNMRIIYRRLFFFFFELIIRKRYVRIEESRDQISFLYFIYR